jgi:hypothetical protein
MGKNCMESANNLVVGRSVGPPKPWVTVIEKVGKNILNLPINDGRRTSRGPKDRLVFAFGDQGVAQVHGQRLSVMGRAKQRRENAPIL